MPISRGPSSLYTFPNMARSRGAPLPWIGIEYPPYSNGRALDPESGGTIALFLERAKALFLVFAMGSGDSETNRESQVHGDFSLRRPTTIDSGSVGKELAMFPNPQRFYLSEPDPRVIKLLLELPRSQFIHSQK